MNLSINTMKVYVPAKDFDESKRFYAALGFELTDAWGGNVDCKLGNAEFRLQNYYAEGWANNFMMQFWVDDIHGWYEHGKTVIGNFNARIKEIEMVEDRMLFHIWDPCGVLLIFIK